MNPTTYVDWHCKSCGHHHETTKRAYSYPVACPECGQETTVVGPKVFPTNRVRRDEAPQSYDLLHPQEKEIQFYFTALTGERIGMVLDQESAANIISDDPIEVLREVIEAKRRRYIIASDLPRAESVLQIMEDHADESEANRRNNRLNELRKQIVYANIEYDELTSPDQE